MSTLSLRLPESYHERLRALAKRENVSINQLILTALGEKLSALDTEALLKDRAARGSAKRFRKALERIPDVPCQPEDEIDK